MGVGWSSSTTTPASTGAQLRCKTLSGGGGNRTRATLLPARGALVVLRPDKRELDGLLPPHSPTFCVESRRASFAKPLTSGAEVARAPRLEDSWPGADAQLFPPCLDGAFEADRVLVSSETAGDHGEPEDLGDLPDFRSVRNTGLERAQPVPLREGVVAPVLSAVGEVVIVPELLGKRFSALELSGRQQRPANAIDRRRDECVLSKAARELEVLLEQLECSPPFSGLDQRITQGVARFEESWLIPDAAPELDRLVESAHRGRELTPCDVEGTQTRKRPCRVRPVVTSGCERAFEPLHTF